MIVLLVVVSFVLGITATHLDDASAINECQKRYVVAKCEVVVRPVKE